MPIQKSNRDEEEARKLGLVNEAKFSEDLFIYYKAGDRFKWGKQASDDKAFENGAIFNTDDADSLKENNAPVPSVNVLQDGIDQLVAGLTAKKPRFTATARENSDVKLASTYSELFSYIWDVSDGNRQLKRAIRDYEVVGIGCLMAYIDPYADNGKGEIFIREIDPEDLYVDPTARRSDCADAAHIMTVQQFSKRQIQIMYPDFDFTGTRETRDEHHASHTRSEEDDQTVNSYKFGDTSGDDNPFYDVIDRYTKKRIQYFKVFDPYSDLEKIMTAEDYEEYKKNMAVIRVQDGQEPEYTTRPSEVKALMGIIEELNKSNPTQNPTRGSAEFMIDPRTGDPTAVEYNGDGSTVGVVVKLQVTQIENLVEMGVIRIDFPVLTRIFRILTIGNKELYSNIEEISEYPIVTFMLHHNRNPYAYGDTRKVKSLVEQLNKLESLIISHAYKVTNFKVMYPEGTVDESELKSQFDAPGTRFLKYNGDDPAARGIHILAPPPLSNEVYILRQHYTGEIQREIGAFAFQAGDVSQAPPTARGTLLMDEMANRRTQSKREDIEESINQLAKSIVQMIPQVYTERKVIRITDPNHKTKEVVLNDRSTEEVIHDVATWKYDIKVVSGSMLPSLRHARFEAYMEMWNAPRQLISDPAFVLRESDLPNIEEYLEKNDVIVQRDQMIAQLQEENKNLKGDLQTASRKAINADERAIVSDFKSKIKGQEAKLESNINLTTMRLGDVVKEANKKSDVTSKESVKEK